MEAINLSAPGVDVIGSVCDCPEALHIRWQVIANGQRLRGEHLLELPDRHGWDTNAALRHGIEQQIVRLAVLVAAARAHAMARLN